jgi:hypothetical protein
MRFRWTPLWGALALSFTFACTPPAPADQGSSDPSWYRDAQPIVQERCQGCHVEGGIAPFALTSFEDVAARADQISASVRSGRMPPWMPDETQCRPIKDSRRLTSLEVETLAAWVEAGAPEGTAVQQKPLETQAQLPWIDKRMDIGLDYQPVATRDDDYRCFILDPQLSDSKDLIGFEVTPGSRQMVHHVLLYSMPLADAQGLDARTAGPGWTCFGGPGNGFPKLVGGWVPGSGAVRFPSGTGIQLVAGDVLVAQVHYNLAKGMTSDRTAVALQYAQIPVQHHAQMLPLVQQRFSIPPRAVDYSTSVTFDSPVTATLWGLVPHMHTKGVSIKVEASNSSAAGCLIDIPKWDFHWQQFYFFDARGGIQIPTGTRLKMTCTWTNPTDKIVRWGEGTDDEMCLAFVYVTG